MRTKLLVVYSFCTVLVVAMIVVSLCHIRFCAGEDETLGDVVTDTAKRLATHLTDLFSVSTVTAWEGGFRSSECASLHTVSARNGPHSNTRATLDFCSFCDMPETYRQLRHLRVDASALSRSVAHQASAIRLRRVFERIATGETITVAVLGGSISAPAADLSAGHIVSYVDVFFKWLQDHSFTNSSQGHRLINGAIPATGSSYFRYCLEQTIGNDVDLVLVDMAVNDVGGDVNAPGGLFTKDSASNVIVHEEIFLRRLLGLPSKPAVILVHFGWLREFSNAQETLNTLASFYDVPAISYKNMLFGWLSSPSIVHRATAKPHLFTTTNNPEEGNPQVEEMKVADDPRELLHQKLGEILVDRMHPTSRGHAQLAWCLIHYIQSHVLWCDRKPMGQPSIDKLLSIGEETVINDRLVTVDSNEGEAIAFIGNSLRDSGNSSNSATPPGCLTVQGLRPNLQPTLVTDDGWHLYSHSSPSQNHQPTTKTYWRGTRTGSAISFVINVQHHQSHVYVYSLVAPYLESTAACWLEPKRQAQSQPIASQPKLATESTTYRLSLQANADQNQSNTSDFADSNLTPVAVLIRSYNSSPWAVAVGVKHHIGKVVEPGLQTITCQLRSGHDFRIIAILFD